MHQLQNQIHGPGENRSVSVLSVPSAPSVVTVTDRGPVHSRLGSGVPERVVLRAPGHHSASIKHSDLPAVSSQMQAKLAKLSEHVDLNDLLPTNRANLVEQSSSSARANENQKERISSFAGWVRAFSVFALHRSHHFPQMIGPLLLYQDVIASTADPNSGYSTSQWLSYDAQFRLLAKLRNLILH